MLTQSIHRHWPILLLSFLFVGTVVAWRTWDKTATTSNSMPHTLGTVDSPGDMAEHLQKAMTQAFRRIDRSVAQNDIPAARKYMNALQNYQREALSLTRHLGAGQMQSLAQICTDHLDVFKTNRYLLPERDHLDGMIVIAGCYALQGAAE